jgi:beta-phosphoglucomutase-like phosphatase (HAD superfamily)
MEHQLAPSEEDVERLAKSIVTMGPHSEVPGVLRRLRERYKLAIITNSDDDLIVHNVKKIGVPIDYVITAEQAQAYKPSRQIFEHAHRTMGVSKDETVHVAMGMVVDMQACHELGIRAIWINRWARRATRIGCPTRNCPTQARARPAAAARGRRVRSGALEQIWALRPAGRADLNHIAISANIAASIRLILAAGLTSDRAAEGGGDGGADGGTRGRCRAEPCL